MHRLPPLWHRSTQDALPGRARASAILAFKTESVVYSFTKNTKKKRRLRGSFVDRQGKRPSKVVGFPVNSEKKMSTIGATADILRAKA